MDNPYIWVVVKATEGCNNSPIVFACAAAAQRDLRIVSAHMSGPDVVVVVKNGVGPYARVRAWLGETRGEAPYPDGTCLFHLESPSEWPNQYGRSQ